MGPPVKGDVVVVPFAFSDLTRAKRRVFTLRRLGAGRRPRTALRPGPTARARCTGTFKPIAGHSVLQMPTTIQVPDELKERLARHKKHPRQPYYEVIAELLDWIEEDDAELTDETRAALEASRREIAEGRFRTLDEIKAERDL